MRLSATPFLLLVLLGLMAAATRRTAGRGRLRTAEALTIYALLIVFAAWGVLSSALAITDIYSRPDFLALLPGLWLPLVPFAIAIGGALLFARLRSALLAVINDTPLHWQILVHGMRVLAIGTFIKVYAGEFPAYFALIVGVPDFLFGVSAFIFGHHARRRTPSRRTLIAWNLVGIAAVISAPLLAQMGLSGPMQIFTSEPTAEALFDFPMVLAPTIVVPVFLLLNMAALVAALLRDPAPLHHNHP